jgi:hypothetical protein
MPRLVTGIIVSFALAAGAPAGAVEQLADADANALLGADVQGPNWTADPVVARNGFSRTYALTTPYGKFDVEGDRRLRDRLAELRALDQLEKVSRTEVFVEALAKAGLAPLRFGRDLITNPLETAGNLFSGVANIFDRAAAEVYQRDASRDGTVESILGVQKARREIAFALGVDAYTDFKPLDGALSDVAGAMAAGDISVTAAFSAIPGGAGVAVSGTATADQISARVRDKTSAEIAMTVQTGLEGLGVEAGVIREFLENQFFTPADQLAIADALKTMKAKDSGLFVARAAQANSVDKAKFLRARAEVTAANSGKLGGLVAFVSFADYTLARNAKGQLVAVFPFDEIAWTGLVEKSFGRLTAEVGTLGEREKPLLAHTGPVTPEAAAELAKLGWQTIRI